MTTYLITGASSGMGEAMARQLCGGGHTVYGVARRREKLEALAAHYPQLFIAFPGDVSDQEAVRRICAGLPALPDVAILDAGIGDFDGKDRVDVALHERMFATNYFGALYFIAELFERFAQRGSGKFVGIASLAGYRGLPTGAAYCASKAALSVALEAMRLTYADTGVEFVAVHPGFVASPMTAKNPRRLPFLWPAEKAAAHILAGIEKGKLSINFPWPLHLAVSLGRLAPPRWYRRLMKNQ